MGGEFHWLEMMRNRHDTVLRFFHTYLKLICIILCMNPKWAIMMHWFIFNGPTLIEGMKTCVQC